MIFLINNHDAFSGNISEDGMILLQFLYNPATQLTEPLLTKVHQILTTAGLSSKHIPIPGELFDLRFTILYKRYCHVVMHLLKEYQHLNASNRKQIIDYYLFNNALQELKFLGTGFYYDCKFKQGRATLYKGRAKEANWKEKIQLAGHQQKVGIDAVKEMFSSCREHINTGGQIELKSYSKCFVLDLFKYISLYPKTNEEFIADIYVKKNAPINCIQIGEERITIQQYIEADYPLENTEFIIDFSEPRDFNRDNFNRWYQAFMETDFKKGNQIPPNINQYSDINAFFRDYLANNQQPTLVSLMVSPVADHEVIVSGELWETVDFAPYHLESDALIHFSFTESELFELIVAYFVEFFNQINQSVLLESFYETVLKMISSLQEQLTNSIEAQPNTLSEQVLQGSKKLEHIKNILKQDCTNTKIRGLLQLIDWEYEKSFWQQENMKSFDLQKIYNKRNENLYINVLKFICVDVARRIYFEY